MSSNQTQGGSQRDSPSMVTRPVIASTASTMMASWLSVRRFKCGLKALRVAIISLMVGLGLDAGRCGKPRYSTFSDHPPLPESQESPMLIGEGIVVVTPNTKPRQNDGWLVPKLQFGNLCLTSSSLPSRQKLELQILGSQARASLTLS